MYISLTFDQEFTHLMLNLRSTYGKELFEIDGIGDDCLDINKFAKKFFNVNASTTADTSIDANSNVSDKNSIIFDHEFSKPVQKLNSYYLLWKELKKQHGLSEANRIIENQLIGRYYINDGYRITNPYCFNYSCYDVALLGLPMVSKIKSVSPKYFYSFKSQLEQFLVIAANSSLGATGISDFLIVSSYYVKKILETKGDSHFKFATEEDCWIYVKENLFSLIYILNQPNRAAQSPFTNISIFDDNFLDNLCPSYQFADGQADKEIVKKLQVMFLDCMNETLERTPVTFPVTTACFSIDEESNINDEDFLDMISEKNSKFGFINIYSGKTSTLSSCCRLRSDIVTEYANSIGGTSTKIGSIGVVTLNLPRIAYESESKEDFLERIISYTMDAAFINNAKRKIIKKRIELGALPLYTHGFMSLNQQYSTCGLNGLNESITHLGMDILEESGQNFVIDMLNVINKTNDKMKKRFAAPHNCEQVPAESSSLKLVAKDRYMGYRPIVNFYSNQFVPLTTKADMLDRIRLQGMFDKHFSGGAICHLNVAEKVKPHKIKELIQISAKMGVVYFALNYQLNECQNGHMTIGQIDTCQICGSKITNVYTRVVGFLTNVKNWAETRRIEDFPNRQFYDVVK